MRLLTNLVFKVTLSSMVLTAPAMITGKSRYDADMGTAGRKDDPRAYNTVNVIKRFVDHPTVVAMHAFPSSTTNATNADAAVATAPATTNTASAVTKATAANSATTAANTRSAATAAKTAELRMVIRQATLLYSAMDLQDFGLDPKAFEYAWRGYHNLLKRGSIHKKAVLSICDFTQSSRSKRMYVIDVQHRKLLYRTYVTHGQNSGDEYASSFSNEMDSYKSSLGFYITLKTYMGRNGLSLRLDGVDAGYNDMAMKRMIVLHGSPYAGERYMTDYGNLGTSLGCPAIPLKITARIIRTVKDGSCLFIYHPTPQYLDHSTVLHG